MKARQIHLLVLLGFLALWQVLAACSLLPPDKLPSPLQVLARLSELASGGELWQALQVSLYRVWLGYSLACGLGLLAGVLLFQWSWLAQSFGTLVPGFLSLPAAAWLPIALLWFPGQPEYAIQLMILLGALFSIIYATEQGMRHVSPVLVKAARTMGSKGWRLSTTVLLPAAAPAILAGLKQGWAFAWRALMTAELVTEGLGFGNLLKAGQQRRDMATLLSCMALILAIGWAVDFLFFAPLEQKLRQRYGLQH